MARSSMRTLVGPLPTTRRGRYEYRKKKYARNYARQNANRLRVEKTMAGDDVLRRAGDWTLRGDGRQQRPPGLSPERGHGVVLSGFIGGGYVRSITSAAQHVPPTASITRPVNVHLSDGTQHTKQAVHGYFVRRRKYLGRKVNPKPRATQFARAVFKATQFFNENGWFPLWDPLHRLPH